jgi:UrcA family protein
MPKTILFAAAALSLCLAAAPALAAPPAGAAARRVSFADLDLATADGRAQLGHRIAMAIEQVCGSYAAASVSDTSDIDRCRAEARTGIETRLAALRARTMTEVALRSR